jgi:radical SAM superfamily enzyme YgiQ (UPF0313 family)
MRRRRLILVNPVNPDRSGLSINQSSRFPPIGLGIIAALTPRDWDIKLIDENWEPFAYQEADLVGLTAFTASANRAYEIAAIYRRKNIPVIMGGIHASTCYAEAIKHVDAVVLGEAEKVWPKVLADFESGHLKSRYEGGWSDLSNATWSRRDLFHPSYMFSSIQTSRGCPLDCEFCSVTTFNGRRYRRRPPEEVLDEVAAIPQKLLFFVDDNIIGYDQNSRDQTLAIFKGMVKRKLNKWWMCQASLNFADDEEVIAWAGRAGCKMVVLGLEAEEVSALNEVHKRLNIQRGVQFYKQAFRRIQRAGIAVVGAFIFGLDSDTPDTLRRRANYVIRCGVDVMQTTYLTPMPGTRLFDRLYQEGRLLFTYFPKDWEHYDMTEPTYRPKKIAANELARIMKALNQRMYSWPVIIYKALATFFQTRDFVSTVFALYSNMNYGGVWRKKSIVRYLPGR